MVVLFPIEEKNNKNQGFSERKKKSKESRVITFFESKDLFKAIKPLREEKK